MSSSKCSNDDCSFRTTCINKFYSKIKGDDGYYYCKQCANEKEQFEERHIQTAINLYNDYLKNKHTKHYQNKDNIPPRLDEVIKYKYLNQYIKNQIPKHEETIVKDFKEYVLIEKSDFLELEVLLWKKNIKFEKLMEQREHKIIKQKSGMTEDEREELLKQQEKHREEIRQRPHEDKIRRRKKKIEISMEKKKEKMDEYKDTPLPEGYKEKEIKKCDYCQGHYCFPFEYMISEKEEKRRKSYKGIICDYCIEAKEYEKAQLTEVCDCGGTYINRPYHIQQHHSTKKHTEWWKNCRLTNGKSKDYYTYKMADLRKLCSKNNKASKTTIIEDYYKLKKDELLKALIEIDKEGLLLITKL